MILTRRTCLRGLGLAMALPWLEQLGWGADAPAGAAQPPKRVCYVTFPNGTIRDQWRYQGQAIDGSDGRKVPRILEGLRPHFADLLVLHGISHPPADFGPSGSGDHARGVATLLSGVRVRKAGARHELGISADQLVAGHCGGHTPLPSLELALEGALGGGVCDNGYPCSYMSHVSWRSPSQPMAKEVSPKAAFLRLFADRRDANAGVRAARQLEQASLLDLVREEANDLRRGLGVGDARKVDEYLESVRAVEARIQAVAERGEARAALEPDPATVAAGARMPEQVPRNFAEHARLMFDIVALAFQTDTTRVATVMLGNASSNRTFPEIGISSSHHELTHHAGDRQKKERVAAINAYQVEQFGYLIERLKQIGEGGARLLDHSLLFYGSGLGDGNQHDHVDLPLLVAGNCGGTVRTGRVVPRARGNLNDLHLAMLQRLGLPLERFADSATPLPDLG